MTRALSDLARSSAERRALKFARGCSRRWCSISIVFFTVASFSIIAIGAWRGELDAGPVAMAAFLLLFAQLQSFSRALYRMLERQADEMAALQKSAPPRPRAVDRDEMAGYPSE